MKILFIRPKPSPATIGLQHVMIVEPLELEILAALIKEDHEVRIIDMILENKGIDYFIKRINPDVLCLTGYITHIPVIIEYCNIAKQINRNIITIVGGVHIEKFPGDIEHESVDYRVVRNATITFPQLIDYLNSKSDFPRGVLGAHDVPDENILPDYNFFTPLPYRELTAKYRKNYFYVFHNKVALIKTSYGCPYQCKFCFCRKITGDNYFARPLCEVLDELESINEKEIYIVDDDFLLSTDRIREFIRLLKERKIRKRYLLYGRADFISKNPELIRDFKEVGLKTVIVGFESFNDFELKEFNKLIDSDTNRTAMSVLNDYKIDCYAAVIISPSWTTDDFIKAGDIMTDLGIKFVNLQPLTPLKGTGLIINENDLIIKRTDYAKWDLAHVSIRPEKMSVKDFYINILDLYQRIVLKPRNLIGFIKYPIGLQFKMVKGIRKVRKQYRNNIMEIAENA
jgi:radical SAM superfamily enzyme YgiQ (UPF0313 family)